MLLYNIIIVLITLICILLTLVILLQNGQGSGLTGIAASGMMGNSGLGARRTADLLSKATSILGTVFLVLCILANFAIDNSGPSRSILQDGGAVNAPIENPAETPSAVPQQQQQAPTLPPVEGSNDEGGDN
ncbi:preprotein translocase subunit SecG [Balneola sp. MJW-20]|uniref:preprotein translocase subunit SecG n=1 Tax=Gracilimonas aurantiaca TaxID=3234185 RepID=UPI003465A27F